MHKNGIVPVAYLIVILFTIMINRRFLAASIILLYLVICLSEKTSKLFYKNMKLAGQYPPRYDILWADSFL